MSDTALQLPPEIVVPDSVEPYIGWKALQLCEDGTLISPSYPCSWPALKPLEASCHGERSGNHKYYRWTVSSTRPDPTATLDPSFDLPTTTALHLTPAQTWDTDPPKIELPPGLYWTLEPQTEPIVTNLCSCGIYAVDDPAGVRFYVNHSPTPVVIVEVAIWGRLIRGEAGARGQYAYPQHIFAKAKDRDLATLAHIKYGVPLIIDDRKETDDQIDQTPPKHERSKYLKPSLPHALLFLFLCLGALFIAGAFFLPPLPGFILGILSGVPLWLIFQLFKDWDLLAS